MKKNVIEYRLQFKDQHLALSAFKFFQEAHLLLLVSDGTWIDNREGLIFDLFLIV